MEHIMDQILRVVGEARVERAQVGQSDREMHLVISRDHMTQLVDAVGPPPNGKDLDGASWLGATVWIRDVDEPQVLDHAP